MGKGRSGDWVWSRGNVEESAAAADAALKGKGRAAASERPDDRPKAKIRISFRVNQK